MVDPDLCRSGGGTGVQTYGERRPYAVPESLDELVGPAYGQVTLPPELGWTGRTEYDLDQVEDAVVLYERVLVDAVRAQDIVGLINAERLGRLWARLYLPRTVRRIWEIRFPNLAAAA